MQTSGTAPQFSDGTRKTIVTRVPGPPKPQPPPKVSTHRRGGHAKHKGK